MGVDTFYNKVLSYFEGELAAARERLDSGQFTSFKDQVVAGRRLAEALALLAPYARQDQRARHLVKNGEALLRELMSVREVIRKKSATRGFRHTLLITRLLRKKEQLQ